MGSLQSWFLLPSYIVCETSRAIICFAVAKSGLAISSTYVAFSSECLKLAIALLFLIRWLQKDQQATDSIKLTVLKDALLAGRKSQALAYKRTSCAHHMKIIFAYAVPASLYLANNLLYLLGIQLTTVSLLHALMFAKLPLTAIMHHFFIRRQYSSRVWLSLFTICVGLGIYAYSSLPFGAHSGAVDLRQALVGPAIGLAIATISGFASISTEMLLKDDTAFWVAQVWLYFWGTVMSFPLTLIWDGQIRSTNYRTVIDTIHPSHFTSRQYIGSYGSIIFATTAVGLITANILRKKDNLVKLVGASICVVTILAAQILLFPESKAASITPLTVLGLGFITVGAWVYNDSILQPTTTKHYFELAQHDDSEDVADNKKFPSTPMERDSMWDSREPSSCLSASRVRIVLSAVAWIILSLAVWRMQANSKHYTAFIDDARFFQPLQIDQAAWGSSRGSREESECVMKWVEAERLGPKSPRMNNMEMEYATNSSCAVYPIPDNGMIFHIFYSGPHRPFHNVPIDAFLATQRLQDGHRLIYWLDSMDDGTWNETMEHYANSEYRDFVTFSKLEPEKEAVGTCLENMPEFASAEYRKQVNMPVVTYSDLVRILLLNNYGGVWLDTDTILLRDLTPYIRMGPSLPGFHDEGLNNALLVAGPPHVATSKKLMDTACTLPYNRDNFTARFPNVYLPGFHWLYNAGVFHACDDYIHCGFARLPIEWSDVSSIWWGPEGRPQDALKACEDHWEADKPAPAAFHGVFAWHARLNQYDDACLTDRKRPNAAQVLLRRIEEVLEEGLDMRGRDLFPGPGYN